MGDHERVTEGIYQVGGSELSDPNDAAAFVVVCGTELVMIDCGAGRAPEAIVENIEEAGLSPRSITTLILTHCHVDHIGAASYFKERYGCSLVAHALDADAIESGDPTLTAASWYGTTLPRIAVDRRLQGAEEQLVCGGETLRCIHTPGHTPGSICVYVDRSGSRVLFGQDIHGPFARELGSDLGQWRLSMQRLLELGADILCEGHFGTYRPREWVERYIQGYLDQHRA